MTEDIRIRRAGRAGRITLDRPKALNALTWDMVRAIDAALRGWADDPDVALLLIDAEGERAFCAGGDIAVMYERGRAGDFDYGRRFWADEYRMNARLFEWPKPVVSFLHGFTMGGGVGVGCHGSHRVVCETSKLAMPECGIGLVPDVGGSLLLARAPGQLGEYLGLTGTRMGPGDAIHAGFGDYFIPEAEWPALKATLCDTGDWEAVDRVARPAPEAPLAAGQDRIDRLFSGARLADVVTDLETDAGELAQDAVQAMGRNSPLSMACTLELIRRVKARPDAIRNALGLEYRITYRAGEQGDFIEGIRAALIDRDRTPRWRHAGPRHVPLAEMSAMLMPLGDDSLHFEGV